MAFALLCELSLGRRLWAMAVLCLGLLLSYSGSGLLILAIGLLFPLGRAGLLRFAGTAALAAVVFYFFGDALNLSYTAGRVEEIGTANSSAYCRFVDPIAVMLPEFEANGWISLLGLGPGTLHKMYGTCETTFGKVPFEYGLLGTVAFAALYLGALARPGLPMRIRAGLFAQWATQPFLLAPEALLLTYLLCAMWPRESATALPTTAERPKR
jgi:hypothetical protein